MKVEFEAQTAVIQNEHTSKYFMSNLHPVLIIEEFIKQLYITYNESKPADQHMSLPTIPAIVLIMSQNDVINNLKF